MALTAALLAVGALTVQSAHAEDIPTFSFADCPDLPDGQNPRHWTCNEAHVTSGKFVLGSLDQDITETIKFTYATGLDLATGKQITVFGRMRAEQMQVREGIFGDPILTAVYAKPQYAGSFDVKPGPLWNIALKLKVINPVLGHNCQIGTDSDPIALKLIIGTTNPPPPNTPISGVKPVIVSKNPPVIKATIVDNAFSVPGASGCGLGLGLMNAVVNSQAGVPSAAGRNTAIFVQYASFKKYTDIG